MNEEGRTRVTVLAGFSAAAVEAVARALLVADPGLVMLSHDLSGVRDGLVARTLRDADGIIESGVTRLVHGCVSCTLREDVLPTLVGLKQERVLLALPPAIEPEAVAAAARAEAGGSVHFDSFVTVVEAAAVVDDLTSSDDLRDRELHAAANDHRAVADVVVGQIEFADTLVVWGAGSPRLDALLHRLAPWAAMVRVGDSPTVDCTALAGQLLGTGRHDPAVPGMIARALHGYPIGIHDPAGAHGVNAALFHARRPFHPQRLHDALDDLTDQPVRGRGQIWIASQPEAAIGWESAGGGLRLGSLGSWLAALPRERWEEAEPMRRLAAEVDWDPYYGDRRTVLSFVGAGLDTGALLGLLESCLLTDAELSAGSGGWQALPDPFAELTTT